MRAVVQRVTQASVEIDGRRHSAIGKGLLVLLGVQQGDSREDADYLARKIGGLRIFEDSGGKMNLSVVEVGGAALVVSQFTLCGDCRKGRRPSFDNAAPPHEADRLYEYFIQKLRDEHGIPVHSGVFQQHMLVRIANDGPVTLIVNSAP